MVDESPLAALPETEPWLLEHLCARAALEPAAVSCHFLDRRGEVSLTLTTLDIVQGARRVAENLARAGVGPGDRVLCSLPTSPAFVLTFLGLQWLGAVPVPLPEVRRGLGKLNIAERIHHVVSDCAPAGIVVGSEAEREMLEQDSGTAGKVRIWTAGELDTAAALSQTLEQPWRPSTGEELAFLQYTSGSTAEPKGVMISHRALRANLLAICAGSEAVDDDVSLTWLPLYHDMGLIGGLLVPLRASVTVYLMTPLTFLARPALWLECISRYGVSVSPATTLAYQLCTKHIDEKRLAALDLRRWRLAYCGAEPIKLETLEAFQSRFARAGFSARAFFPVYGMAETSLAATFPKPGAPLRVDRVRRRELAEKGRAEPPRAGDSNEDILTLVSTGRVLPGHAITIRAVDGEQEQPERVLGEICLSGPSLFSGYYRTRDAVAGLVHELRTGDVGYLSEGELFVVDRLKDLIKIGGASYFPSDVEAMLDGVIGLRPGRVAAFEVPDDARGTGALAIACELENADCDPRTVESAINSLVQRALGLTPAVVAFWARGALPLTSSGKVQRYKARQLHLQGGAATRGDGS